MLETNLKLSYDVVALLDVILVLMLILGFPREAVTHPFLY